MKRIFLILLAVSIIIGFFIWDFGFVFLFIGFFILVFYIIYKSESKRNKILDRGGIQYVNQKYNDNILRDKLERWNDYQYELSGDKKSVHLNKTIYDLEKKIERLYTETKYHDALVITQQIFQIVKENYDLSHPFFTLTITNLGNLYQEIGNYVEARSYLEKALEIRQEILEENHPHISSKYD